MPLAAPLYTDANTVANWLFDEAAGTTMADATGTYPVTWFNNPTVVAGQFGNARHFVAASSQYGIAAADATIKNLFNAGTEWTIQSVLKATNTGSYRGIFCLDSPTVGSQEVLGIYLAPGSSDLFIETRGTGGSLNAPIGLSTVAYKLLTVTRRASDGKIRVYVDDTLLYTSPSSYGPPNLSMASDIQIRIGSGESTSPTLYPFSGDLDQIRIYGRERVLSEIQNDFAGIQDPPAPVPPTPPAPEDPAEEESEPEETGPSEAELLVREHLNPMLQGPFWDALVAAVAAGDTINLENSKAAFDQLFKSSASGPYLDRKASDDGIRRPAGVGMSDDLYRRLAIKVTSNKLLAHVVWEILEIFYGAEAVRAYSTTDLQQPFSLADGQTLQVLLDELDSYNITFNSADFTQIAGASAREVAAVITRQLQLQGSTAFALPFTDPETGINKVRIYSGSLGLGGSVRITGGQAQNGLHFATYLTSAPTGTWSVTVPTPGKLRFTLTGATALDLLQVRTGDYVNIFNPLANAANQGSFPITRVDVQYPGGVLTQIFEVDVEGGVAQSLPINVATDMVFFRPQRQVIDNSKTALVTQPEPGVLYVVLPATTAAVGRTEGSGAYLQPTQDVAIASILRKPDGTAKVTVSADHGLAVGQQVFIDGAVPASARPAVSAGTPGSTTDASPVSSWSSLTALGLAAEDVPTIRLANGDVYYGGGIVLPSQTSVDADTLFLYKLDEAGANDAAIDETGNCTTTASSGTRSVVGGRWGSARYFNGNGRLRAPTTAAIRTAVTNRGYSIDFWAYIPSASVPVWGNWAGLISIEDDAPSSVIGSAIAVTNTGATNPIQFLWGSSATSFNFISSGSGSEIIPTDQWAHFAVTVTNTGGSTSSVQLSVNGVAYAAVGGWSFTPNGAGSTYVVLGSQQQFGGVWTTGPFTGALDQVRFTNRILNSTEIQAAGLSVVRSQAGRVHIASTSVLTDGGIRYGYSMPATASLPATRVSHALTLLTDSLQSGKVLISGGYSGSAAVSTSYLYDPTGNTYSASIALPAARMKHEAVLLDSGKVLVCGGASNSITSLATTALWTSNAGSGAWAAAASMAQARTDFQAVKLNDGRVLVMGGRVFTASSSLFPDESVLSMGTLLASCEIYDPNTNTWSATGAMSCVRAFHRAVVLPDGRVLVMGGFGHVPSQPSTAAALRSCEIYDPKTGRWHSAGRLSTGRWKHRAVYLASRKQVLVFGAASGAVDRYDVTTGTWGSAVAAIQRQDNGGAAIIGTDAGVVIIGGRNASAAVTTASMLIPNSDSVSAHGLNAMHKITSVPSSTTFEVETLDQYSSTGTAEATVVGAQAGEHLGPFVFDSTEGFGITDTKTTTTMNLDAGLQYRSLTVADASKFPDEEGHIVIAFGTKLQIGPLKYLGRLSPTELVLDSRVLMPVTAPSGATVTLLKTATPYVPDDPESVGSLYLTASSAGRVAASASIDSVLAAGFEVEKTVKYPGDRGLGGAGLPTVGVQKLNDSVIVWGGDDIDTELETAREA
jgi:hypothetical protein